MCGLPQGYGTLLTRRACFCRSCLLQVRLNFLSALLPEAYGHLHQHLCASALHRKLLLLPFHRDVVLDASAAQAMMATVQYCKQVGS